MDWHPWVPRYQATVPGCGTYLPPGLAYHCLCASCGREHLGDALVCDVVMYCTLCCVCVLYLGDIHPTEDTTKTNLEVRSRVATG